MKHSIFLILIFFYLFSLSGSDVYARKPKSKTSCTVSRGKFTASDLLEFNYGFVVGENMSTIKNKKGDSQDIMTGMLGGIVVQMVWPKGFIVQPEILYSKKGTMFMDTEIKYDIDYVEVPIQFMYRLQITEVKPFVFIAPYGAYALKLTAQSDLVSDETYADQINQWDYGIGAGAGFDVWKIQLSFKYSWGFAKIITNDKFTVRNKTFTISAGFLF